MSMYEAEIQIPSEAELKALQQTVGTLCSPSGDEWRQFLSLWVKLRFNRNAIITPEGQVEKYLYVVLKGVQRLYHTDGEGNELILGFSYDGSYSGAYDSLVKQKPSLTQLQALSNTELLGLSYAGLQKAFEYPCFERWGRRLAENILFGRGLREIEMQTLSAEERYLRLLERNPRVLRMVPQKHLASYLGMSAETLSRVRGRIS